MPLNNPAQVDFPDTLRIPTLNRYVVPGWSSYSVALHTILANTQYTIPIFVSRDITAIRIGVKVDIAEAGKSARLGILHWGNGLPAAVLLDAGTVSLAAVAIVEITISQDLARGYYFLTFVSDSAGGACFVASFGAGTINFAPVPGHDSSLSGNPYGIVYTKGAESGQVAGGLTDPAPAPTGIQGSTAAGVVMLREN